MSMATSLTVKTTGGQIVLQGTECCRLPQNSWQLRVVSGRAWISYAGQDVLLSSNDHLSSADLRGYGKDQAVISAVGNTPLTMAFQVSEEI